MVEKGFYEHYKGGIYKVIGVANHTEGLGLKVIYYDAKGELHARPIAMWDEIVDGKPRFQLLRKRDGEIKFAIMRNYYLKYKK